jgi:hypothetical protein
VRYFAPAAAMLIATADRLSAGDSAVLQKRANP